MSEVPLYSEQCLCGGSDLACRGLKCQSKSTTQTSNGLLPEIPISVPAWAQGYLAHKTPPPLWYLTIALCIGTYGDAIEVGVSDEQGTPVGLRF